MAKADISQAEPEILLTLTVFEARWLRATAQIALRPEDDRGPGHQSLVSIFDALDRVLRQLGPKS
jgi:hypothetical protein